MGERYKVLIVEDEVLVRGGLKSVIGWERLGMEIVGDAANGKQALEIYERSKPDIILTDIKMPVMDGLELIARIRETDSNTKIVILTCYEEFGYLQEAMRMGVSDYISKLKMKPAEIEASMEKIKRELEEREDTQSSSRTEKTLQKEEILKQYIFYHQIPIDIFRARVEELHLSVHEGDIVLCRMILRRYEKVQSKISDAQGMLIRFLIMNMAGEIIKNYGKGEIIQEKEDGYLFLINVDRGEENNFRTLTYMLNEISRTLSGYMGSQVLWGISRIYQSWDKLPLMYQECCTALQYTYFERGIIFRYSPVRLKEAADRMLDDTAGVLEGGGEFWREETEYVLKQLNEYITEGGLTKENAESALIRSLYRCREKVGQTFQEDMLMEAVKDIRESDTFSDAAHIYTECCRKAVEQQRLLSVEIYEAVRYIEEHLAEKLTLNQVAFHIGLSPNYLSSLFKKELHISFVDYITESRVKRAKELLMETDLKTHQVAEITGFADDSYFSKTFKKITGKLPSSFRKRKQL